MNDRAVTALGKIYREDLNAKEVWELYAENMFPGKKHAIISPVFKADSNLSPSSVQFSHIDLRYFDHTSYKKYAYHPGTSRGGDATLTTKFSANGAVKKIKSVLENVLPRCLKYGESNKCEDVALLKQIMHLWKDDIRITNGLEEQLKGLDKEFQLNCGLSLIVETPEAPLFASDLPTFKVALVKYFEEGLSEFSNKTSIGDSHTCSICLKDNLKVYGFASPFKYFTVDKPGYLPNYFNLKLAWKNYPVCRECADDFYLGARAIKEEFRFSFYRRRYMAVPRLLITDNSQMHTVYDLFREYKKQDGSNLESYEDAMMLFMAEQENSFNVDMLFFDENPTTKAIDVILHLEEVFPSRFKKIFVDARDHVDTHPVFCNHLTFEENSYDKESGKRLDQKTIFRQRFRFGKLLDFFEEEGYSIIQSVFDGKDITEATLYTAFMNKYRENYNKVLQGKPHKNPRKLIIDAISVIYFLHYLGSLKINTKNYEVKMPQEIENPGKGGIDLDAIKAFIDDNPVFFNKEYKIGIFLLGVLVKLVMNAQQVRLQNTPFEKKLKGYKISGGDIESIYVEALSKLQQYYDAYAYGNLRKFMTEYLNLKLPEIKSASSAEISFYFVTGMETQFKFKSQSEPGENNE